MNMETKNRINTDVMETIECKLKLLLSTYLLLKELSCRPQIGMTVTWIDEDGRWILDG